jgi:hypothetical protein
MAAMCSSSQSSAVHELVADKGKAIKLKPLRDRLPEP